MVGIALVYFRLDWKLCVRHSVSLLYVQSAVYSLHQHPELTTRSCITNHQSVSQSVSAHYGVTKCVKATRNIY